MTRTWTLEYEGQEALTELEFDIVVTMFVRHTGPTVAPKMWDNSAEQNALNQVLKTDGLPHINLDCRPELSGGLGCIYDQPASLVSLVSFSEHRRNQIIHSICSPYTSKLLIRLMQAAEPGELQEHDGQLPGPVQPHSSSQQPKLPTIQYMFANTPLIYVMQESITKDESPTRDRHLHKSMPKLRNDNSHA